MVRCQYEPGADMAPVAVVGVGCGWVPNDTLRTSQRLSQGTGIHREARRAWRRAAAREGDQ